MRGYPRREVDVMSESDYLKLVIREPSGALDWSGGVKTPARSRTGKEGWI